MYGFRGRANQYWSHGCPNIPALTGEYLQVEGSRESLRQGDWAGDLPRGFAIYSSNLHLEVGGFDHAFDRFADRTLAAKLHSRGYRWGYAAAAAARYPVTTGPKELILHDPTCSGAMTPRQRSVG